MQINECNGKFNNYLSFLTKFFFFLKTSLYAFDYIAKPIKKPPMKLVVTYVF